MAPKQGVSSAGVSGVMGISICLLAILKLMDVEAFAACLRKNDLPTQRWRAWGRLYPGIELLAGGSRGPQARARPLVSSRASPEAITTRVSTPSSTE